MITSTLIDQLRRQYGDIPKSVSVSREGNGTASLFNTGKFPIVESSPVVYVGGQLKVDTTDYQFDLDSGNLQLTSIPQNGVEVYSDFKTAEWRDKNWVEAINESIEGLNARGFFRQIVGDKTSFAISGGVQNYSGPVGAVDVYELLVSNNNTSAGFFNKIRGNWSYQQDANKIVLNDKPSSSNVAQISYLRNLKTFSATSATIDVLEDWIELVKKKAGATFYRSLAGKIAKQGNATVDEGHFSFTNLRTMANDLDAEFDKLALRKKPTRPAKDVQYFI